jgi:hypothetical protein
MTIAAARDAFPRGNGMMKIQDELESLFEDSDFTALYPKIWTTGMIL